MKALITGASSGIGREMSLYLSELGCDLILVAKEKDKLEELQKELKTKSQIIVIDLANEKKIKDLYMITKNENIDILINNAGFGLCGDYNEADLPTELNMIDVNVKAVHILTRMYLKDFANRNSGYILNVASCAGLLKGGPLMSCYYATKAYITSFTSAIYEELRRNKSHVRIACLCPGPVKTNFNDVANVKFNIKQLSARDVARFAINNLFKTNKLLLVPGTSVKLGVFITRFLPVKTILKITYRIQERQNK